MAARTDIDVALAELEAGKFSFRMVETIKDHVATLEADLGRANTAYESAANTLRQQEYTISRLEAELRKANARIHTLVKANALTEAAMREGKRCALALREFLLIACEHAVVLIKKALAWLSTVDLKDSLERAKSHPLTQKAQAGIANLDLQAEWKKLQAHPLTEKARRELQTALVKMQEYLPVAQKQLAALVDKALAFIAKLHNKAA
ncbi:hypothetical protein ACNHKD_16925 [Methylocystis sp. JAN1]|uniref:hypothetical protein n=1 Tax=Methylocystis sp. JAN1 TaxID=3397211 RepID=UPI003FA23A4F